jgi:hypothetical protein
MVDFVNISSGLSQYLLCKYSYVYIYVKAISMIWNLGDLIDNQDHNIHIIGSLIVSRSHVEGPIRRTREGGSEWEPIKILLEGDGDSNKTNTASNTRL